MICIPVRRRVFIPPLAGASPLRIDYNDISHLQLIPARINLQCVNTMIEINPRYEAIFNPDNIDQDCDKIASLMSDEGEFIKEALDAGLYKQAVTMYLQLLKSMCEHFIEDEHWCYFDDMYSPESRCNGYTRRYARLRLSERRAKLRLVLSRA